MSVFQLCNVVLHVEGIIEESILVCALEISFALRLFLFGQSQRPLQIILLLSDLASSFRLLLLHPHTLGDRFLQIIVFVASSRRWPVRSVMSVSEIPVTLQTTCRQIAQHAIPHGTSRLSLGSQSVVVLKQVGDVLSLLSDIGADVFPSLVDIDKLFQCSAISTGGLLIAHLTM